LPNNLVNHNKYPPNTYMWEKIKFDFVQWKLSGYHRVGAFYLCQFSQLLTSNHQDEYNTCKNTINVSQYDNSVYRMLRLHIR